MAGELKNFNYKAFSKSLADQAVQVIPQDLEQQDKDYTVEIIHRFCEMAGEALVQDESSTLKPMQAELVVQLIGEWIFHKSVDIARAKIDTNFREGILQKVAFTVFEVSKKAVEKDMPQDQLISLVESHVKKTFEKAMEELEEKGVLSEEDAKNALSQSNIDAMSEQIQEIRENEELAHASEIISMSDSKVIKLASLAVLIKNFPQEKIKNILSKFNKPERDVLIKYLKMPDLEEKLDARATMKCFEEMKNTLPEAVTISYEKAFRKLYKIVKNSDKTKILNIIRNERPAVIDFVLSCYNKKRRKIPAYVADVISKYLEENVS